MASTVPSILHTAKWRPDPALRHNQGDIFSGLVSLETISHKDLFRQGAPDSHENTSESAEISDEQSLSQNLPENELNVLADHVYKQDFVNEICSLDDVTGIDEWVCLGLHPVLGKYLVKAGYTKPRSIQEQTIRHALHNKSLVIAAETGSGKTLAYLLPALHKAFTLVTNAIKRPEQAQRRGLQTLIIAPTRELASQINTVMTTIFSDIQKCFHLMYTIVGGISPQKQERFIRERPLILVGTPGRLYDIYKQNKFLADSSMLDRIVVDESDKMLQKGHFSELIDLCSALTSELKDGTTARVTISSATISLPSILRERKIKFSNAEDEDEVKSSNQGRTWKEKKLTRKKMNKFDKAIWATKKGLTLEISNAREVPETQMKIYNSWLGVLNNLGFSGSKLVIVDISPDCVVNKAVLELWNHTLDEAEKNVLMAYLVIRYKYPTIIFVKNIEHAKKYAAIFQLLGVPAWCVHSSMPQRQRYKNIDRLRERNDTVLIATDVCARGIDIPHVSLVIQHSSPDSASSHIHRVGRAARVESESTSRYVGMAVSFISPEDNGRFAQIASVCGYTQRTMPPAIEIHDGIMKRIKQLWSLATEATEALSENQEFMRRISYMQRDEKNFSAVDADLDVDGAIGNRINDVLDDPEVFSVSHELVANIQHARSQLSSLLSQPIKKYLQTIKSTKHQVIKDVVKQRNGALGLLEEMPRELKFSGNSRGVPTLVSESKVSSKRTSSGAVKKKHAKWKRVVKI